MPPHRLAVASPDYESVFRAAPGNYALLDRSLNIVAVNDAFCAATKTVRERIVGRPFFEVFPENPEDPERDAGRRTRESFARVLATRSADRLGLTRYDIPRPAEDGGGFEERYWSPCSTPILDADGEVSGILYWVEDVSEFVRLKAEAEPHPPQDELRARARGIDAEVFLGLEAVNAMRRLGESERRYRFLADAVPMSIFTATPEGKVDYCNERFRATTGLPIEHIVGDGWLAAVHEADRAATRGAWEESVAAGVAFQVEHRLTQRDGGYRWAYTTARPYRDASGAVVKWFGASADIHDRVVAEEQLRQAQRLQAVGKLASGFAHEVNNMMMVIVSAGDFALRTLVQGHPARADVEEMLKAAARANDITAQLLAYSRQQVLRPRVLDLREIVEGLVPALKRLVGTDRHIETRLPDERAFVCVDRSQMELVLINLVANARDATKTDGRIEVEVEVDPPPTDAAASAHERYARVIVRDDGTGMEPDVAARAFEPFFTTKLPGHGTGLGLSMVYGVVQQSGGFARIESAPGRGTVVCIELPLDGSMPEPSLGPPSAEYSGTEHILVVEDDLIVRRLVHRALETHGYTVYEAPTGIAALEFMAAHGSEVDLVLTDVVMPRMTGPELVEHLRHDHPEVPVVFMSGYTGSEILDRGFRLANAPLLQKPFGVDALLATIRQQLETRRRQAPGSPGPGRDKASAGP